MPGNVEGRNTWAAVTNYPTAWQRRVLWTVATYLAIAGGVAVAVELVSFFGQAVGFLQPVLIPFAIAAVLAYLLHPIVRLLTARTRLSRTGAVLVVFALMLLVLSLLSALVVPRLYDSSARMIQDLPAYLQKAQERLTRLLDVAEEKVDKLNHLLPSSSPAPDAMPDDALKTSPTTASGVPGEIPPAPAPPVSPTAQNAPAPDAEITRMDGDETVTAGRGGSQTGGEVVTPAPDSPKDTQGKADDKPSVKELLAPHGIRNYIQKQIPFLEAKIPELLDSLLHLVLKGISVAALLIDAIIIPVYLYFLLVEAHNIGRHWNEYLPIRDSPFKKEVVSVLLEINTYLVAFFRGQLIVSTIDGLLIGGMLALFVHLDFSFFIGLLVVVLTFIPYLGIILCYIPAILVAIVQYGDWQHPLMVVAVMFVTQTLESTIISPKIVGDSVGLHPVTVILSVFGWSLLLNGPIGAILAVPLSATVKVLLRRYIWEKSGHGRHLVPLAAASMGALQAEVQRTAEATQGKSDADGPRAASEPVATAISPAKPNGHSEKHEP